MPTYKVDELARLAGVPPRTVRYYVERRVLPRPRFRGSATAYSDEHLLVLRVIGRLRETEHLRLDAIRKRIARLSAAELRALLPAPVALETEASASQAPPSESADEAAEPDSAAPHPEAWERTCLVPGMELHVRTDASALVRRLAAEIKAAYGASIEGERPQG